ncbi:hypothetical protein ACFW6V_25765 [Streptomyces sp. NPDC058734]
MRKFKGLITECTKDDRPLLKEVYAGMTDLITAFEHGHQIALSA